jgi:branched-subunit amino acid aminotransferase/4-amino-4-deoxychorismate lyase
MFVLYETLRSFDGCFALLPWHQRRLEQACRVLNIPCPDLQLLVKPFVGIKDVRVRVDVDQVGGVEGLFFVP